MSKRKVLFSIFCLLFLINGFGQKKQVKPNVLFIICDDLNDYQGVFGGHPQSKTPNIKTVARKYLIKSTKTTRNYLC
jgi:hypothetical protein